MVILNDRPLPRHVRKEIQLDAAVFLCGVVSRLDETPYHLSLPPLLATDTLPPDVCAICVAVARARWAEIGA